MAESPLMQRNTIAHGSRHADWQFTTLLGHSVACHECPLCTTKRNNGHFCCNAAPLGAIGLKHTLVIGLG